MKIALVTEYYYPDVGGMPEHVYFLGRELQRRGHDVTVITADFGPAPPDMPDGLRVERLGPSVLVYSNGSLSRMTVGVALGRRMREILHDSGFDIIHVHSPTFPVLPLLAIKTAPPEATLVGTFHTNFESLVLMRIFGPVLQRYLDALNGIIAVAPSAGRSAERYNRVRYRMIPTGVDLEYFGGGRRRPELDDGRLNVMSLSRMEPRSDIPRLLDAFRLVRREMEGVRLVLIGDGPPLPLYRQLVDPAIRDDVVFAGTRISERADFLASCDVFCFTARIAASPVSLREGMAAGRACVANAIEGCTELIESGHDGLLVPLEGAEPLARAILQLLRDQDQRNRLGQNARRRVAEFDWPIIAGRIEHYYIELRERQGTPLFAR